MSEAPSNALIEERRKLTETLDEARQQHTAATGTLQTAKAAVLQFDAKHPEVMRFLNFVVGEAKKAGGGE